MLDESSAAVKVTGGLLPEGEEQWCYLDEDDVAGCFDGNGALYPAAEDYVLQQAVEDVAHRCKKADEAAGE